MKKLNKLSIILALFAAVACSDSDKKTAEDAINNNTPQTTFTAATDGTVGNSVSSQASHGTCTISNDESHVIYEKTDLSFQEQDECYTNEFNIGCGGVYTIDFSQPIPSLIRYNVPC